MQVSIGRRFIESISFNLKKFLAKMRLIEGPVVDLNFLLRYMGYQSFQPGQEEIIRSILSGRDTLVILPTGGGKSLCYQLPAIYFNGLTIVISPLIALMRDQVAALHRKAIPSTYINSSISKKEKTRREELLQMGLFKLLYVAPERFTAKFDTLDSVGVSSFVVDEAHCIDMWGYDFRPDYLRLKDICEELGRPPIVAVTATATHRVRENIIKNLGMQNPRIFVRGFNRPNVSFNVIHCKSTKEKQEKLSELLKKLVNPGIVYVPTIKVAEDVCKFIEEETELEVRPYHGKLDSRFRSGVQDGFSDGLIECIVATKAFGMGIDKQDLRFILHYNMPSDISSYYQEIGRAGRDGNPAVGIMLYCEGDDKVQRRLIRKNAPTEKAFELLWRFILNKSENRKVRLQNNEKTELMLKILKKEGYIDFESNHEIALIKILDETPDRTLDIDFNDLTETEDRKLREVDELLDYINTNTCRRRYIMDYFSDREYSSKVPCCDNCVDNSLISKIKRLWTRGQRQMAVHPDLLT